MRVTIILKVYKKTVYQNIIEDSSQNIWIITID